jgi:hypothetical protein
VKLKAPVGPAGAVTGGPEKAEKRGLASAGPRVNPYRRKWITLRLGRKLSPEEIREMLWKLSMKRRVVVDMKRVEQGMCQSCGESYNEKNIFLFSFPLYDVDL